MVLSSEEPPGANVGVPPWRTGIGLDTWPTQFWCKDASNVPAKKKKINGVSGMAILMILCFSLLDVVSGSFCIWGDWDIRLFAFNVCLIYMYYDFVTCLVLSIPYWCLLWTIAIPYLVSFSPPFVSIRTCI